MMSNLHVRGLQAKKVIDALLKSGAWKATLFLSPTEVVRATRRLYRSRRKFNDDRIEIHLTVGKPNYLERDTVKNFRKAMEPFPIKRVQLRFHARRKV